MNELLSKLNGNDLTTFLFFTALALLGALVWIVALVMGNWRRVRVTEMELALKQQMLDKGMSAADIEQVLKASKEPGEQENPRGVRFSDDAKADVVKILAEHELPAADIELVLQAFHELADAQNGTARNEQLGTIESLAEQGMKGADIARVVRAMGKPNAAETAGLVAHLAKVSPPTAN